MVFHRVLDSVFSTWSHVAVLRVLQDSSRGLTGREIARTAGMNHRAGLKALTDLESLSLVRRLRGGRDHIFLLNREHILNKKGILPLLSFEREFSRALFEFLRKRLQKHVVSLIIFGSVARKNETPESDLDVCLIVRTQKDKEVAQLAAHGIAPRLLDEFGAKLSPLLLTGSEFAKRAKRNLPPVNEILKDGVVITGISIRELTHGKK